VTIGFPQNAVVTIAQHMKVAVAGISDLDPTGKAVFTRPLRPSDPAVSGGVFALDWRPDDYEIMGRPNGDPTLATYMLAIQILVKHTDEQEGLALHSETAKAVRSMLYRDAVLRVALTSLTESSLGVTERALKWGVGQQRYANNELNGTFLFLTTTELSLQTQTI